MKTAALAVAATLALLGTAHAERFSAVTGGKLVQICGNPKQSTSCTAYIEGVSDSISLYQELRPQDGSKGAALPAYVCVPSEVTGLRMRDTVVAWIKQHPDSNGRAAAVTVASALREAYACR